MIRVCFRFDDPSPVSDHAVERQLIEELGQRGLCATFAVVPFCEHPREGKRALDHVTAAHLLDAQRKGIIEIAQHGYSHTRFPYLETGQPSEFIGRPLAVQEALIHEGRQLLGDLFESPIEGFVPPWNSGDAATMAALKELGFGYSSSATPSFLGYRGPVCRLPRTCHLNTTERALEEARLFRYLSPIVVIVMHHYDFNEEGGYGFDKLRLLLDRIAGDPGLRVLTLHEVALTSSARKSIQAINNILNKEQAHWRVQRLYPQFCLVQRPIWWAILCRLFVSVFHF